MNFLLALLTFAMGQAKSFVKEPGIAFTQQLVLRIRSLTMLIVAIVGALTLSLVGVSLFIANLANQLDQKEDLTVSGGMILYLVVTVISLAFLGYNLSSKKWLQTSGLVEPSTPPPRPSSSIENAISLLIMDFVQARQQRRAQSESPTQDKAK